MNKKLKRLSVLAVISGLCLLAVTARAQTVFTGTTTLLSGGTNNVLAAATNTTSLRIDVPRTGEVCLYASARPIANGTNWVKLNFILYPSIDGVTAANTDAIVYTFQGTTNSSGIVIGVESITVGAVPYYFITQIGNPDLIHTGVTNLTVAYGAKVAR